MFYVIEIALWLIGLAISLSVYKKINILCNENNAGLDEKTLAELAEQNETTKKTLLCYGNLFSYSHCSWHNSSMDTCKMDFVFRLCFHNSIYFL